MNSDKERENTGAVVDTKVVIVGYFVCQNYKCKNKYRPTNLFESCGGSFPSQICPSCKEDMAFITNNPKR